MVTSLPLYRWQQVTCILHMFAGMPSAVRYTHEISWYRLNCSEHRSMTKNGVCYMLLLTPGPGNVGQPATGPREGVVIHYGRQFSPQSVFCRCDLVTAHSWPLEEWHALQLLLQTPVPQLPKGLLAERGPWRC